MRDRLVLHFASDYGALYSRHRHRERKREREQKMYANLFLTGANLPKLLCHMSGARYYRKKVVFFTLGSSIYTIILFFSLFSFFAVHFIHLAQVHFVKIIDFIKLIYFMIKLVITGGMRGKMGM